MADILATTCASRRAAAAGFFQTPSSASERGSRLVVKNIRLNLHVTHIGGGSRAGHVQHRADGRIPRLFAVVGDESAHLNSEPVIVSLSRGSHAYRSADRFSPVVHRADAELGDSDWLVMPVPFRYERIGLAEMQRHYVHVYSRPQQILRKPCA